MVPQWHNAVFRAEFIYNRLTEKNSFESFFNNYSIFLNAELPFRIGRAQQLTLGTDANISVDADPEGPRRNDYEVYAGYNLALTRAFTLDAVARLVARQYQLTDRVDVSEILSTSANFNISRYFTASAISTLAANQSNHAVFDYKVANVGGLLFALDKILIAVLCSGGLKARPCTERCCVTADRRRLKRRQARRSRRGRLTIARRWFGEPRPPDFPSR